VQQHIRTPTTIIIKSNERRLWLVVMPHPGAPAGRFVRARVGDADQPSESSSLVVVHVVAAAILVVVAIVAVVIRRRRIHLAFFTFDPDVDDAAARRSRAGEPEFTDLLTSTSFRKRNCLHSGVLLGLLLSVVVGAPNRPGRKHNQFLRRFKEESASCWEQSLPVAATAVPGHSGKRHTNTMVGLSMQVEHATPLTGAPCDCRSTALVVQSS
jgi:hypothetical protein